MGSPKRIAAGSAKRIAGGSAKRIILSVTMVVIRLTHAGPNEAETSQVGAPGEELEGVAAVGGRSSASTEAKGE